MKRKLVNTVLYPGSDKLRDVDVFQKGDRLLYIKYKLYMIYNLIA